MRIRTDDCRIWRGEMREEGPGKGMGYPMIEVVDVLFV